MSMKVCTWAPPSTAANACAQLLQRVGAEGREQEEAVGGEHARGLGEHELGPAPLQREIGEQKLRARVAASGRRSASAHTSARPLAPRARASTTAGAGAARASIAGAMSMPTSSRARVAPRERGERGAGAAAEVDDARRLEADGSRCSSRRVADLALQHGAVVVGRRRALEGAADGAASRAAALQPRSVSRVATNALAMREEGKVRGVLELEEPRTRQAGREPAPGFDRHQRVAASVDHDGRLRDRRGVLAQVRLAQHREAVRRARSDRARRARSTRRRSARMAARLFAPPSAFSATNVLSVASQVGAQARGEARECLGFHRVGPAGPLDEAGRGADERQRANAHRMAASEALREEAAERPAAHDRILRARCAAISSTASSRPRNGRQRREAMAGQVEDMHWKRSASAPRTGDQTPPCRPHPWSSTRSGPCPPCLTCSLMARARARGPRRAPRRPRCLSRAQARCAGARCLRAPSAAGSRARGSRRRAAAAATSSARCASPTTTGWIAVVESRTATLARRKRRGTPRCAARKAPTARGFAFEQRPSPRPRRPRPSAAARSSRCRCARVAPATRRPRARRPRTRRSRRAPCRAWPCRRCAASARRSARARRGRVAPSTPMPCASSSTSQASWRSHSASSSRHRRRGRRPC